MLSLVDTITPKPAADFTALVDYLKGPRDRAATLGASWPAAIGGIENRAAFEQTFPNSINAMKRCGEAATQKEAALTDSISPFREIIAQFRALARELTDYVEAPSLPDDLYWNQSAVKAGQRHFIGWHTDGNVTVTKDGRAVSHAPREFPEILQRDDDFTPQHLYLQATTSLPTVFAANMAAVALPDTCFQNVRAGRAYQTVLEPNGLDAHMRDNATLRAAEPAQIIAFPSGTLHSGVASDRMCTRTLFVLRLNMKPRF